MPKINWNKDFTVEEVKKLCKEYNRDIKEFAEFMYGQTIGMKDGKPLYYGCDVERFFKRDNTYFD